MPDTTIVGRPSVDGSEGGTVIVGQDTGLRRIPTTDVGGNYNLRRVGNMVSCDGGWDSAANASTVVDVPAGFRPHVGDSETFTIIAFNWDGGGTAPLQINANTGEWSAPETNAGTVNFSVVWMTNDAWPAELPGDAA